MFRAICDNRANYFILLGVAEKPILYLHFMKWCNDAESKVTCSHSVE